MALTLVIGNKNYSSWSMRPWVALKACNIAFDEVSIPLYTGDADKQRISLFVRKDSESSHETGFRYAVEDGVGVFYWIDDACGYAISGRIDRGQLLSIARVVYSQLAALEAKR